MQTFAPYVLHVPEQPPNAAGVSLCRPRCDKCRSIFAAERVDRQMGREQNNPHHVVKVIPPLFLDCRIVIGRLVPSLCVYPLRALTKRQIMPWPNPIWLASRGG
jgi:hypothetical protein